MNPAHKHRTIAYIIIAIIIVIILGAYIYMILENGNVSNQQPAVSPQTAAQITAQRQATLVPFVPTRFTAAEIKAQQAMLVKH